MALQNKVKDFLNQHQMVSHGDRVLVGVSGGPDSVALLHLLRDLCGEMDLQLEIAHVQHGIRGEEAKEDLWFVGNLAAKLKLPFHLKEVDLPQMRAAAGKGNLEALGRKERYRFFADVAKVRGLTKVATAHTLDDQAETMLMWFLRGAGRKGLSGMEPMQSFREKPDVGSHEILVIRPLLDTAKAELLQFLDARKLKYRLDRTNQDQALLRNWLRLKLMPQLKERIDTHLPARLARQAELLRAEDDFLDRLARQELNNLTRASGLDRKLLVNHPVAMQRRLLRIWLERGLGHLRGLDADHVDALLQVAAAEPPQSRLAIPGGWAFVREYETLRLERLVRKPKRLCYSYCLKIGTELLIPEAGMLVESEKIIETPTCLPADLNEAVFDLACLPEKLAVRNFRNGDRYRPLGMAGHKKVKDLFIEKKVPVSVRAKLPLLTTSNEILWIPGYGRSEIGKIGSQTATVLRLKAVPCGV